MEFRIGNATLQLIKGDLTEQETDALVNAANATLLGGGGVDGAIHSKGGSKILEECKQIRAKEWPDGLPTGNAVITTGGNLRAKYVIHTVGPIWRGGFYDEAKLLRRAYWNSLKLSVAKGLQTVAFPSISTGAYGYPVGEASRVAVGAVVDFLSQENKLERVIFVLFTKETLEIYLRAAHAEVQEKFL
ncbi:MAG: O-acetyl-ADP-ribose deacetylase [Nitrososphaerota archaeon]|jgi:O-acetyl-ADP-ribose deacetylase (regulator of RNase III)|nr:O-acetyl-ADP-ribose deacetylase [Nitrososphaerota archaeon]